MDINNKGRTKMRMMQLNILYLYPSIKTNQSLFISFDNYVTHIHTLLRYIENTNNKV